jgi:hypothetical protein
MRAPLGMRRWLNGDEDQGAEVPTVVCDPAGRGGARLAGDDPILRCSARRFGASRAYPTEGLVQASETPPGPCQPLSMLARPRIGRLLSDVTSGLRFNAGVPEGGFSMRNKSCSYCGKWKIECEHCRGKGYFDLSPYGTSTTHSRPASGLRWRYPTRRGH